MKKIHIDESKFIAVFESKKELPFQTFYTEVLKFIKGILNDPIKTKPSDILVSYGLDNSVLRKKLCDYGVMTKKEDLREPYDETSGKKTSRYYVSYSVPRANFKDKLRKVYNDLFSVNEEITRDEINMMLNSPSTIGVVCDGNSPEYVKQAAKIYNNKIKRKKNERKN